MGAPGLRLPCLGLALAAGLVGQAAAGESERLAALSASHPDWRKAAATVASGNAGIPRQPGAIKSASWVLGRLYRIDETAGKAYFAAFPAGADMPWSPGNAFDPGQTVEVTLKKEGDRLIPAGVTMYNRSSDDRVIENNEDSLPGNRTVESNERFHAGVLAELYAQAQKDAANGIMTCRIRGWALSDSSRGTAVREKPSDEARILGRLPGPRLSWDNEASSSDGWRAEFDITGYKDGWFRIANATPPGAPGDLPPAGAPPTYSGTGWIRVTDAAGAYSNTRMPVPRLLQYPHVDAQDIEPGQDVSSPDGSLSIDGTLARFHACSANWALTTSRDGNRGWYRGICSNQVTTCS